VRILRHLWFPVSFKDPPQSSRLGGSSIIGWKGRDGRLSRCHIKSPSFQNWPAMSFAVAGNVIADFPLVNKSFNLSYSGCDR
jgi:Ni,Fe-hydrogenase III large subunit